MVRNAVTTRHPWQDRWSQPELEELLAALKSHHRRQFELIIEALSQYGEVRQRITWYGPAWKWTIQYVFTRSPRGAQSGRAASGAEAATGTGEELCYLVPNAESPSVCVPLCDALIAHLPMKRLNRYIREGIRGAKFALAIHWATWTPNSQVDVGHLLDLLKRKHKHELEAPDEPAADPKAGSARAKANGHSKLAAAPASSTRTSDRGTSARTPAASRPRTRAANPSSARNGHRKGAGAATDSRRTRR